MVNKYSVSMFLNNIDISENGCWNWTGCSSGWGYGAINMGGNHMLAHRFSWFITYGEIPSGMFVCHHCDNRKCVNPKHLFLGTAKDNMRDKVEKGRHRGPVGDTHFKAKLRSEFIPEIIKMREKGMTYKQIGDIYGVSLSAIFYAIKGKYWKHANRT